MTPGHWIWCIFSHASGSGSLLVDLSLWSSLKYVSEVWMSCAHIRFRQRRNQTDFGDLQIFTRASPAGQSSTFQHQLRRFAHFFFPIVPQTMQVILTTSMILRYIFTVNIYPTPCVKFCTQSKRYLNTLPVINPTVKCVVTGVILNWVSRGHLGPVTVVQVFTAGCERCHWLSVFHWHVPCPPWQIKVLLWLCRLQVTANAFLQHHAVWVIPISRISSPGLHFDLQFYFKP